MNESLFIPTDSFRQQLNLHELTIERLRANYSFDERHNYQAMKYWLSGRYRCQASTQIDRLKPYLQSLEHLVAIPDWSRAVQILIAPIGELSTIEEQDVLGQLQIWGYYQQIVELCHKVIDRVEPESRLIIITRLANALTSLRQYQSALKYYRAALTLATELGKVKIQARVITNIGNIHQWQREYPQAIEYYQQAWEIAEQIDDDRLQLSILGNKGNIFMGIGDFTNAIPWLERSLEIVQKIGDRYAEGISYCNLGIATGGLGKYEEAQAYLLSSLAIARALDDVPGELSALVNLGNNCSYKQDYESAIEYHQQGLQLLTGIDDEVTKFNLLTGVGNGYFFLEDYTKAQTYFEASKEIATRLNYDFGMALALANIGSNVSKMGDLDLAIEHLTAALDRFKQLQAIDLAAMAAHKLAEIYHQNRQNDLAQIYLQFAIGIAKELSLPLLSDCEDLDLRIKPDF
ncbi:MAG: tetratricopeptide repeat protein [Chamaesiphon sp. CSU_1_12]|nr:tetratricopeptide repeat protein [Chamaesiphon sp. CSU_1_12]